MPHGGGALVGRDDDWRRHRRFRAGRIVDAVAHLDEMDVVPEHGQKGIGTRLVNVVCEWARDNGYPRVTLTTFRDVPWNRAFYEKRGFRVVDPGLAGAGHLELMALEAARGLRTDLRVLMTCELA